MVIQNLKDLAIEFGGIWSQMFIANTQGVYTEWEPNSKITFIKLQSTLVRTKKFRSIIQMED